MAKAYKIETERLIIRCYQPTDAPLLKKAIDESLEHLKPWLPWANQEPEELEQKIERLRIFRAMFDSDEDYPFGIFNKTGTELIGSTGLHTRVGADAREIGYWISSRHLQRGYATEAVMALVKTGFDIEGLNRVEIHCDPKNTNSVKIPAKLGFKHEATLAKRVKDTNGHLRDKMIWTLFKEEYEKMPLRDFTLKVFSVTGNSLL